MASLDLGRYRDYLIKVTKISSHSQKSQFAAFSGAKSRIEKCGFRGFRHEKRLIPICVTFRHREAT